MSTTALEVYQKPQSAVDIRARVNLIQEVMTAVMKKDVHYGTIPGTTKPTLYKPGSEILLVTFHIAIEPIVEDLSTQDEARFRVITRATSIGSGQYLGSGVGEASSAEEKYQWREAVCREEWEECDARGKARVKYKKSKNGFYTVDQVRTNVADIANTVLKMAKKRSQIDVTLTVTSASDIFSQDIEDIPEELRGAAEDAAAAQQTAEASQELPTTLKRKSENGTAHSVAPKPQPQPVPKAAAPPVKQAPAPATDVISDGQSRRFFAIWKQAGRTQDEVDAKLMDVMGSRDSRQIPKKIYEQLCTWAEGQF